MNDYYTNTKYGERPQNPPIYMGVNLHSVTPKWEYIVRLNISDSPWTGIDTNTLQVPTPSDYELMATSFFLPVLDVCLWARLGMITAPGPSTT